ncbi:MAG: hypothetical protein DI539_09485 [Flavobacterium psychrophilum]|nr:MAG: hypothetical protein DI539_09485 [Flavobacterium psychrophilum]
MNKPIILPLWLSIVIVIAIISLAVLLGVTFTRPIEYVGILIPTGLFLYRQIQLRHRFKTK